MEVFLARQVRDRDPQQIVEGTRNMVHLQHFGEQDDGGTGGRDRGKLASATLLHPYGSPNVAQVEALVAELEGAESAVAVGSGIAAIAAALTWQAG